MINECEVVVTNHTQWCECVCVCVCVSACSGGNVSEVRELLAMRSSVNYHNPDSSCELLVSQSL